MSDPKTPIGLAVRLPFGSPEEFLQKYGHNLSRGGIYLRARVLRPPGTPVTLEIKLQDGLRIISAIAKVSFVTGASGEGVPGMGLKFIVLDGPSRRFLESAAAAMPHARSDQPPVPRAVGAPDYRPEAVAPAPLPAPPPSQAQGALPSETAGKLVVQGGAPVSVQAPAFEAPDAPPPRTGRIIGIDLGTTNSCAAVVRDGKAEVLKGPDGRSQIPSVVALSQRGVLVVGPAAKAQGHTNPRWTISGFKRLLGRAYDASEVQPIVRAFPWEVVATEDGDCGAKVADHVYRLEEISALVLREVKQLAERQLGEALHRAVITVPAWYTERQRQAVREAGRLAGLHVERIVNEPTAAALAWGYGRKLSQRVLVYDLGGGTFDASVLELNDTVYEVVSTGGDAFLGGMDFDTTIVAWLLSEFEQRTDTIFNDRVAIQRVTDAAEKAKISLSTEREARIHVPFVTLVNNQPVDLDVVLPRQKLVDLTRGLVDKTMDVCQDVLRVRGVRADQVDEILLVGGQARAPLVQERITVLFGKQPRFGVNPEEAVALGAALLAHALETKEGLLLIDVLPQSIGVGLPGGRMHPVIPRNTALPVTRHHAVATSRDDQEEIELSIFQGETGLVRDATWLGSFKIAGLPRAPKGQVTVELTFELNNECLLTLSAREVMSGRAVTATYTTKGTPDAVKKRVQAIEQEPQAPVEAPVKAGLSGWMKKLFGA